MKKIVNQKSKKTHLNTVNNPKISERPKSINGPNLPIPTETEKRKTNKTSTLPKLEMQIEKSELLVTPSKDNHSEIFLQKRDECSIVVQPSPLPRMSTFMTATNLAEVANTSQIKVMARFRPLNSVEQVTKITKIKLIKIGIGN